MDLPHHDLPQRAREALRAKLRGALLLGVASVALSGGAPQGWAQTKVARVGVLTLDTLTENSEEQRWLEPFRRKLAERGWVERRDVSFEYRNAGGDPAGYTAAAAELARLNVDVIFAPSAPAVRASYAATRTIPVVALDLTTDPVAAGYVERHTRRGTNITGVFLDAPDFAGKWLELLKAMIPGLARVAVLWDPSPGDAHLRAIQTAARSFGVQAEVVEVRKPDEIEKAFSAYRSRPQALVILPSPMLYVHAERLAKLTLKQRLPATSMSRRFAEAGGALAYGPDMPATAQRCAILVAKILAGSKPQTLPPEPPERFELVVNLKTAKAIGLTVPESVLAGAEVVIR